MIPTGHDSLNTRSTLTVGSKHYAYYSLENAAAALGDVAHELGRPRVDLGIGLLGWQLGERARAAWVHGTRCASRPE